MAERVQLQAELNAAVSRREAAQSHRRSAIHSVLAQLDSLEQVSSPAVNRTQLDVSHLLARLPAAVADTLGASSRGLLLTPASKQA
jgi:hypothetical protein